MAVFDEIKSEAIGYTKKEGLREIKMTIGKIRIAYLKDSDEILITADADGLRYLSNVCLKLIGKSGPAAHWHLMAEMKSLEPGSVNTIITFE